MKTYLFSLKSSPEEVVLFVRAVALAEKSKGDEFRCIHGRISGEKLVNLGKDSLPALGGLKGDIGTDASTPLDPPKFDHPI